MLKENADKISDDDKRKIETAASELKEALKGTDVAAIKSATEKLNEAWQAVSAELYKAASEKTKAGKAQPDPKQSADASDSRRKDEGPIIDAEVVDAKKS